MDTFVKRFLLAGLAALCAASLLATSVIPISDSELYRRTDVIVHGVVISSDVTVDGLGRPETLTVIEPLSVLKGRLSGPLVLHQPGGALPDGRFFHLWGRPEYVPGREVVVFAIERPEGEYQTAEMMLGKFEVWQDDAGNRFAIPDLAIGIHPGVQVRERPRKLRSQSARVDGSAEGESLPRLLDRFLLFVRTGRFEESVTAAPSGKLEPIRHAQDRSGHVIPQWGFLDDTLYRWNNGATAAWSLSGTTNIDGGGVAEAGGALAAWTNEPNSTINYSQGTGTSNVIYLDATSSALGCGWTTCISLGGIIGCGGPSGTGGSNVWRGETYATITQGALELRAYCSHNLYDSALTQSVLEHELGHTLGLGHSDQNVTPHDVCLGDEDAAIMRSIVQNTTPLGTDDRDAVRWIYGDGMNSCSVQAAPTVASVTPGVGPATGGTLVTIGGASFQAGATVSFGGVAATGVAVLDGTTIAATTGAHAAGAVNVIITNPDAQSGTLAGGFIYGGVGFFTVAPCRLVDTRNPDSPLGGPPLIAGTDRSFPLAGQCGIPAGARAVSVNVAVVQPTDGPGYLTLYPGASSLPVASTINYRAGQIRGNNAIIALGAAGDILVRCEQGSGTANMVIDVNGYFQ